MTKISRLLQAICPLLNALREPGPFPLGGRDISKQKITGFSVAYD
jgi:hypothetical protein